ncbi:MAG: hypothetical protein H6536_01835 [Bacteroidales bacterium]|nr:hypothetical protein [Bacteroidales bacterium]
MDAGDYIYIIIAIVIAIINAIASKRKKDEARRKAAQSAPETTMRDPVDVLQEILMGAPVAQTPQQSSDDVLDDEDEQHVVEVERPTAIWRVETQPDYVNSVEVNQPVEVVEESTLYPTPSASFIDSPENAQFTPIDIPTVELDTISEYNYDEQAPIATSDETPDMIFDHERAMEYDAAERSFADDFDARQAIIYAEIMKPKYA